MAESQLAKKRKREEEDEEEYRRYRLHEMECDYRLSLMDAAKGLIEGWQAPNDLDEVIIRFERAIAAARRRRNKARFLLKRAFSVVHDLKEKVQLAVSEKEKT